MIIAIDPGKSGSIVGENNGQTLAWPMPQTREQAISTFRTLRGIATDDELKVVYIEEQQGAGSVRSNPVHMFRFGCFYERVIMAAMFAGFDIVFVSSMKWMKVLNLGTIGTQRAPRGSSEEFKKQLAKDNRRLKTEWKIHLRDTARGLYPAQASKITLKNCDALLILAYARKVTTS